MPSLKTLLDPLIKLLKENEKSYSLDRITQSMGQDTYALILLFFSLPFAFPLTIPGLSVPFGIVLFFLGLRFTLNKSFWLPRFIRKKSISRSHLHLSIKILANFLKKMRKILKPRIPSLFKTPVITGTV
ncbi:MAG: exopolysaccharide biosynthesis protein, partial [Chlamydiae bacterium]|nr:exopolysaccharide biosynthesis protein [Chlamydiota bacterium]